MDVLLLALHLQIFLPESRSADRREWNADPSKVSPGTIFPRISWYLEKLHRDPHPDEETQRYADKIAGRIVDGQNRLALRQTNLDNDHQNRENEDRPQSSAGDADTQRYLRDVRIFRGVQLRAPGSHSSRASPSHERHFEFA